MRNGNSQVLKKNGATVISAADTDITQIGRGGLGYGSRYVATDDIGLEWQLINFVVTDQTPAPGGGPPDGLRTLMLTGVGV